MISDSFAATYANHGADGIYYNGGTWMRIEICGYVAGMLHGWSPAKEAIANRLWAEIEHRPGIPNQPGIHRYRPGESLLRIPPGFRVEFVCAARRWSWRDCERPKWTLIFRIRKIIAQSGLVRKVECNVAEWLIAVFASHSASAR